MSTEHVTGKLRYETHGKREYLYLGEGDLKEAGKQALQTVASPIVGTAQVGIGLGTGILQVGEAILSVPWNLFAEIKVGLEGVMRDSSVRDGTNVWRPAYTKTGALTSVKWANPFQADIQAAPQGMSRDTDSD